MSAAIEEGRLVIAVPSKGRLQENATAFFARAGLPLAKARGARDYRGVITGLADVEILFLSAGEIVTQLASGSAHLGVTGEDLLRESVPDVETTMELVTGLGFGYANVVVAVPQAWIDVRTMRDLDEVAGDIRHRHGRQIRVATKYLNLTRRFFAASGVADYRIVESLGATEGAPAAGTADLIVDITTTGATLAANGLKVLDDGVILKSEANLIASLKAPWSASARAAVTTVLARIAAEEEARTTREVRALLQAGPASLQEALRDFGAPIVIREAPGGETVLRCPTQRVFDLVERLTDLGAQDVTVRALDYIFHRRNPMAERLLGRLGG